MINAVLAQYAAMIKLIAFLGHIQFWKYFSTLTWRKFVEYSDMYSHRIEPCSWNCKNLVKGCCAIWLSHSCWDYKF
ncbi:hypothetical protein NPIL_677801 [Nephila pilipes]|uniref:Uncharacterized protein n=1 Tax=Nephila pilipes TaxID=299642 RepID=A0A8X6U0F1_NEPPI|nr:hypothetical protein NPIL_677801 [Nephila pilipes]